MEPLTPQERETPIAPPPALGTPVASTGPGGRTGASAPEDLACISCGYSLGGLDINTKCPECGRDIQVSLEQGLLRFADPMWVDSLHRSATTIAWGMGTCFAVSFAINLVSQFVVSLPLMLVGALAGLGMLLCKWVGLWGIAAPNPALRTGDKMGPGPVIRKAILVQIVAALAVFPLAIFGLLTGSGAILLAAVGAGAAVFIAWVVEIVFAMRVVKHLAIRVPDANLAKWAGVYSWLVPVLMTVGALLIVGPLAGMILYIATFGWLRKGLNQARMMQQGVMPPSMGARQPLAREAA